MNLTQLLTRNIQLRPHQVLKTDLRKPYWENREKGVANPTYDETTWSL